METFDPSQIVANKTWLDKAIDNVAPSWGLSRLESRVTKALFEYNAARTNRLYNPKQYGQVSESPQTVRDRIIMMWEARDLVENVPEIRASSRVFGINLTPTEYSPMTGDREYNAEVSEYFHAWCKSADVTGRHSFKKLIQLAAEERPVDGDCGFVIRRAGEGLKIQLVPATRIGNPNNQTDISQNYYQGIFTNDYGQPIAYRIFRVDRSGIYFDPEDVPAANFCHYFDPFRVDQYRGVTDFHSGIRTARSLYEILEAEKAGVRFASQQAALVFSDRGTANPRNLFTPNPAVTLGNGQQQQNELSEVGMIRYFGNADKIEVMPSRPSQAFTGFVQHLMHEISLAVGIPQAVLFGSQGYQGPSVRAEFAAADRVFTRHQGVLVDKVLDPIKNAVLIDAIARGELSAPSLNAGETMVQALRRATAGEWRFPAKLSIDVGRESAANLNENRQGAKSLAEIASEEGTDAFSRLEQIAIEASFIKELSSKYGVPETSIRLVTNSLPSTPAAAAAAGDNVGAAAAAAQVASSSSVAPSDAVPSDDSAGASNLPKENGALEENCVTINFETESYLPTNAIAENARQALKVRETKPQSQRGMTAVGIARARDLMNKRPLSEDSVRRMKAFFDRHEVDKQGETWDEKGKGWQAWNGWGGDEGYVWATSIVERLNKQAEKKSLSITEAEVQHHFARSAPLRAEEWLDVVQKYRGKLQLDEHESCPVETQDIAANLANRKNAVDVARYGPANPREENEPFWDAKAEQFKTTQAEARTMRCGNCAAFNQSERIKKCISTGIGADADEVERAGNLGYCEAFDFKCAALRTCDAWIVGGPITDEKQMAKVGPRGGIVESDKAPKSDTPREDPKGEGSAKGDASGKRGAEVSADQEKTLQNKADDFNEKDSNTRNGRATLGALKSVFQRGLGAFNTSSSPRVTSAAQWAFARVNAFLYLLKNGRPENEGYTTDYDLLPEKHPKAGK
jgi:capsid protein